MFNIAFEQEAQKEFLKLDKASQQLIANKIIDLQNGIFTSDKSDIM